MKKPHQSIPPVGFSHGSYGKNEMLLRNLRQMQLVVIDPEAELKAFYESSQKQPGIDIDFKSAAD